MILAFIMGANICFDFGDFGAHFDCGLCYN